MTSVINLSMTWQNGVFIKANTCVTIAITLTGAYQNYVTTVQYCIRPYYVAATITLTNVSFAAQRNFGQSACRTPEFRASSILRRGKKIPTRRQKLFLVQNYMAAFQDDEYDQVRLGHLNEDIDELESVLRTSLNSKRNRAYLERYLKQLRAEQTNLTRKKISEHDQPCETMEGANEGYEPIPDGPHNDVAMNPSSTQQQKRVPPTPASSGRWSVPSSYGWDQSDKFVSIYVSGLPGVGDLPKENIHCKFEKSSFDLTVVGLNGEDYRLRITNLDKAIDAKGCKFKIKSDRIIVMLRKVKGEYGPDHWSDLKSKKSKESKEKIEKDPTAGIMDLMKDMYESGDDKMRETIGKAMMESQKNRANPDHRSPGGNWGSTSSDPIDF